MILSASQIRPSNNIRTGLCVYNSPVILYILMIEIISNYSDIYQDTEAGPPKYQRKSSLFIFKKNSGYE